MPIVTIGEIVTLADDGALAPLSDDSMSLINIDGFQSDGRFLGIDGSGFAAVILDTGIDLDHSFFGPDVDQDGVADRIVYQYDFADGDADASDQNGHGSNVSSIIGSSDSVYGGVAPGTDIIHLKVFSDSGSGSFSYVEQALQWVIDNTTLYNIASVNMSLGDGGNHTSSQSLYGIADEIAALASLDVITVSASGNKFYEVNSIQGVQYPAADPNSLSVGAVYDDSTGGYTYGDGAKSFSTGPDAITPFSQRDADLTDIFAPGAPITGAGSDGGLVTMHGTSQASPHIAGVAVLAQQLASQMLGRRLTVSEFSDLLVDTGVTINDGDDEDDNVTNTDLDFSRVDVLALGDAIYSMVEITTYYEIAATDAVNPEGDSGSTPFTFTVTRSGDTSISSEVSYAVTGSGADAADATDFGGALPSGTLSFAAGEMSKVLTVSVSGDLKLEADEGFTVTLSAPSAGSEITTAAATGTIENDDIAPTVVEVRVSSSSDDAEEKASGSVSLSSSDLEMIQDSSAQTVGIRFAGIEVPQGATIVDAYLQFQVDEKDTGETTLEIRAEAVDDAATFSSSSFDITSRAVTSASSTWSPPAWSTVGEAGAAQQTSDLTAVVQEIVDRGGWSAANAMAFVIDGVGKRVAESFDGKAAAAPLLHIEYVEAPAVAPATSYEIVATDAANPEGDSGTTPFEFTVTRSGDTTVSSEVDYAVTGSGADAADAADFGGALQTGTVSFIAGEISKVITIDVSGDADMEADEGFTVTLSNPSAGSEITTASAAGTIENDDTELAISATGAVKPEGDAGTTAFTFTVTRSGDVSGTTDVAYAVTGSGADAADATDFGGALPSGTVSFAAGETSKVLTIDVSGDADMEADEGFTVTLSNPSGGALITTASAQGTIENDDTELAISATDAVKPEGDAGTTAFTFTVTRSGDVSGTTDVAYAVTGSGADAADATDFGGALPSGTVSLAAGETSKVLTIDVSGDADMEADEGFTVTLSNPSDGALITTASAAGTIENDDTELAISATDAVKPEGDAGTTAFTFTITRSGDVSGTTDVAYAVTGSGGDAADTTDFGGALPSGTVSFAAGETSKVVTIDVSGDADMEADEGFTVTLSNPSDGAVITTASAQGTIENDDAAPPATIYSIAATDAANPEGDSGSTPFTFTVTRSGNTSVSSDVDYAVTGSGADAADGSDFGGALPSGTVSFAAGETSKILTLDISGDSDVEVDEGFTVTLSAPSAGSEIGTATATGTIENDDAAPPPPAEPTVVEVRVSSSSDDAEEKASGSVSLSSSDLEMIQDSSAQTVGIRFAGIEVPQGATIVDAYLQFQVDEKDTGETTLEIRGEAVDDAATFSSSSFDITSRAVTSASSTWSPPAWSTVGEAGAAQQTSDLTAVVQEIVDRGGWSAANAMAFVIDGVGKRVAESFDGKAAAAPLLHIEYVEAPAAAPATSYEIVATDAANPEGDSGTTPFEFTVTRSGDTTVSSEVDYMVTGSGADAADATDFGGALCGRRDIEGRHHRRLGRRRHGSGRRFHGDAVEPDPQLRHRDSERHGDDRKRRYRTGNFGDRRGEAGRRRRNHGVHVHGHAVR